VETQKDNSTVPPLREIDGPTGIDLYPDPPETVRVSKRAGLLVLILLCGLASVFGWGIYRRANQDVAAPFSREDSRKVVPATTAAQEITKQIPAAMINVSSQSKETPNDKNVSANPFGPKSTPQIPNLDQPRRANSSPRPEQTARVPRPETPQATQPREPTPAERLLAESYRRQLQAIVAPTAVRSGNLGLGASASYTPATSLDASGLVSLAQGLKSILPANPATSVNSDHQTDPNMKSQKQNFLAQARSTNGSNYLPPTRTAPISKYEVKAGWEIPATLEQDLNSDLPGEVRALVTENVYDTATGQYLLIPQGSRLVGTYDSNIAYGQNSLQVVWRRIIYPDASSIDLGGMVGQDAHGAAGFRYGVDNHYSRLIGFTLLSSAFSAGFQLSQSRRGTVLQNPNVGEIAAGAVGQEVSQVGAQVTRKNLDVQPTIKIPVGYKFNVRVNRDILFDGPYTPSKSTNQE
jgi:type IV secretion system protein VirB10